MISIRNIINTAKDIIKKPIESIDKDEYNEIDALKNLNSNINRIDNNIVQTKNSNNTNDEIRYKNSLDE